MRPIDADALLECVQFKLPVDNSNAEIIKGCVDITRRLIDNAPTLTLDDLREKGEWVPYEPEIALYGCSNCDHKIFHAINPPNYCPNCGAKMGGGE